MQEQIDLPQSPTGRTYQILEPLGKGGFGTVYRARVFSEGGFSKEVAIKLLNSDKADIADYGQRLRDEARILGLIRHRAIVTVDGLVRLDGRWAVVMEYVGGADLKSVLRSEPIPPGPALEITREVASALHVAYSHLGPDGEPMRLIHRDIKPSNVQITQAGEVKVLDFGIARAEFDSREATTNDQLFGSLAYMSPERRDLVEGPQADIYSLGCLLFEMLTGDQVGQTSARQEKHQERLDSATERLSLRYSEQADLIDLVAAMLAYEAEDRPNARAVERACSRLRMALGDQELLRDWAEERVPKWMAQRTPLPADDMLGAMLSEQTSAVSLRQRDQETADTPAISAPAMLSEVDAADSWLQPDQSMEEVSSFEPPPELAEETEPARRRIPLVLVAVLAAIALIAVGAVGWWSLSRAGISGSVAALQSGPQITGTVSVEDTDDPRRAKPKQPSRAPVQAPVKVADDVAVFEEPDAVAQALPERAEAEGTVDEPVAPDLQEVVEDGEEAAEAGEEAAKAGEEAAEAGEEEPDVSQDGDGGNDAGTADPPTDATEGSAPPSEEEPEGAAEEPPKAFSLDDFNGRWRGGRQFTGRKVRQPLQMRIQLDPGGRVTGYSEIKIGAQIRKSRLDGSYTQGEDGNISVQITEQAGAKVITYRGRLNARGGGSGEMLMNGSARGTWSAQWGS